MGYARKQFNKKRKKHGFSRPKSQGKRNRSVEQALARGEYNDNDRGDDWDA